MGLPSFISRSWRSKLVSKKIFLSNHFFIEEIKAWFDVLVHNCFIQIASFFMQMPIVYHSNVFAMSYPYICGKVWVQKYLFPTGSSSLASSRSISQRVFIWCKDCLLNLSSIMHNFQIKPSLRSSQKKLIWRPWLPLCSKLEKILGHWNALPHMVPALLFKFVM